jgi:dTMP kinase
VLEGIDGSGTTSQSAALAAALRERGHAVSETREPSRGPIGKLVRERLAVAADPLDRAALALLFAADRLDHWTREIEPALSRGRVVICDRYVLSSLAYQSLDVPEAWVESINARARRPDLTFLLEVPASVALARVRSRRLTSVEPTEIYDEEATQARLAARYADIATRADTGLVGEVIRVDGTPDANAVTRVLLATCLERGL